MPRQYLPNLNMNTMYISTKIKDQRQKFIDALFDPHEPIAFGKDDSTANKPTLDRNEFIDSDAEKFCINPVWDWRVTENICITSLLFEVDEKGLTPKEQAKLFLKSGLPFTTMVYSGGKSIHVILRFKHLFQSKAWSYQWWYAIARVLEKKGIIADPAARLVTQLSRVPCTIREGTGKEQTLITIRDRVSHSEVLQWIQSNGDMVRQPPKPKKIEPLDIHIEMDDEQKWRIANKWTTRKHDEEFNIWNNSGNWVWLFDFGVNCYNIGVNLERAIAISQAQWGVTTSGSNGNFAISEPITKGWRWVQNKN